MLLLKTQDVPLTIKKLGTECVATWDDLEKEGKGPAQEAVPATGSGARPSSAKPRVNSKSPESLAKPK